jgi:hypothetical protein
MLDLNMIMLEPTTISVYGQPVTVDANMLANLEYSVDVSVETQGTRDAQNANMMQMISLVQSNIQVVPEADKIIVDLLGKIASNLKLPNIAKTIKMSSLANQGQDEMKQEIDRLKAELEYQKGQSEIAKNNSQAALNEAKAIKEHVSAQTEAYGV